MISGILIAVILVAAALLRTELVRMRGARELLGLMAAGSDDATERLYSLDGIIGRLIPELQWAALTDRSVAVVLTRWYAPAEQVSALAATIAGVLRAHECVFRTDPQELMISITAGEDFEVLHAVRRIISTAIERDGQRVGDVGSAIFPRDATEIDPLVAVARSRMRPWQEWIDVAEQHPWTAA